MSVWGPTEIAPRPPKPPRKRPSRPPQPLKQPQDSDMGIKQEDGLIKEEGQTNYEGDGVGTTTT